MREALPFVLLACACGAAARSDPSTARSSAGNPTAGAGATAPVLTAGFEGLLARAPAVAPGMREIARRESTADKVEIVRAEQRDTCVRVAFEAPAPVVGRLVDGAGAVLAISGDPANQGVLGPLGPVCVRRGDSVSAVADGPGVRVRWVGWGAP
ncbi:MAG TPA: hypothetical protein VKU41_17175 [Polyangiaceae bacterium]|nr:hypothetical protein [Polyangiaceae bacterium]